MFTAVFLQIRLALVVIIPLAPLYSGTMARAAAISPSQRGPSVMRQCGRVAPPQSHDPMSAQVLGRRLPIGTKYEEHQ